MMRLLLVVVIALGYTGYHYWGLSLEDGHSEYGQQAPEVVGHALAHDAGADSVDNAASNAGDQRIRQAYTNQASDVQVEASGTVVKVLEDDIHPPRHQRFVLKLDNGITLLVAHNIDLADRVADLKPGDTVRFYGEYEWNKKGGVVHWTHHDPQGRHAAGWLRHNGNTYQ